MSKKLDELCARRGRVFDKMAKLLDNSQRHYASSVNVIPRRYDAQSFYKEMRDLNAKLEKLNDEIIIVSEMSEARAVGA